MKKNEGRKSCETVHLTSQENKKNVTSHIIEFTLGTFSKIKDLQEFIF
jgi:hypothetical protein